MDKTKLVRDTLGFHPSNLVPYVLVIVLAIYCYDYFLGLSDSDSYIVQDNNKLHSKIEELEKKLEDTMRRREAGHVGVTYH